jgi:hypothetical protein
VLKTLPLNTRSFLISLVLSFEIGQLFSLQQMHDVANTFFQQLKIERIDLNTLCMIGEQLIQDALLYTSSVGERKAKSISLLQYQCNPEIPIFSIGVTPEDILSFYDNLGPVVSGELERTIKDRTRRNQT